MKKYIIVFLLFSFAVHSQTKRDPRVVALAGSYTTIANGIFSVGYSGDTLDVKEKNTLFRELEDADGMAFFMDTHMPIPLLNISMGNKAFTANNIILQNYRLPMGLLELMFYGNGQKADLDLEFNYEILGINEYGFSFGIPFRSMSWGVTAKYIQGLFYLGVDEDSSSSNLITDDLGIYGSGK